MSMLYLKPTKDAPSITQNTRNYQYVDLEPCHFSLLPFSIIIGRAYHPIICTYLRTELFHYTYGAPT